MSHDQRQGGTETVVFQLFVAGGEQHSRRAESNLRAVCEAHLPGRHRIEIVNVLECSDVALARQVFLTPALVKVSPPPQTTVYGNLHDRDKVLEALGLSSEEP